MPSGYTSIATKLNVYLLRTIPICGEIYLLNSVLNKPVKAIPAGWNVCNPWKRPCRNSSLCRPALPFRVGQGPLYLAFFILQGIYAMP
jgi:hypothetical protein